MTKRTIRGVRERIVVKPTGTHYFSPILQGHAPLEALFTVLKNRMRWVSPMLPGLVRCMVTQGPRTRLLIEEIPQVRTIAWQSPSYEVSGYCSWRLAFPFVVFILDATYDDHDRWQFGALRCFYGKRPITDLDASLYVANLTHVNYLGSAHYPGHLRDFYRGEVCMDGGGGVPSRTYNSLQELVDYALRIFWDARFDDHEREGYDTYALPKSPYHDVRVALLKRWQEESLKDPTFIMRVRLKKFALVKDIFFEDMPEPSAHDLFVHATQVFQLGGLRALIRRQGLGAVGGGG